MTDIKKLINDNLSTTEMIAATKSYCPLLWSHLHVAATGQVMPCCVGDWKLPIGDINKDTFDEIWHGKEINKLRKALIQDKKVPHCKTCYLKEDESGFSLRHDAITKFHEVSKPMVLSTTKDGSAAKAKPVYLDIRFSNICNMRCKMCGHFSSSNWYADAKRLSKDHDIHNYDTEIDQAIIHGVQDSKTLLDRLEEYLPYVQEIYFAGGEPLFMEEHYTILNKLIELGLTDVHIRYSTNLSIMKYKRTHVVDMWKHFTNVYCAGSIDTYGKRAENIRKETVWSEIQDHMTLITEKTPHVKVGISPTIQILNAYTVCELNKQWIENNWVDKWGMFWNILQNPSFYNVQNLPDHMKEEVESIWLSHLDWLHVNETSSVYSTIHTAIKWMNSKKCDEKELVELCKHTQILDALRNEDTRATFPELNYIWENYWYDSTS